MENTMKMPASYLVMNEEEMTYTEGGATATQAIFALFIPVYGWYKGITTARNYRRSHPNNWMDTGIDALISNSEQSVTNMIYNYACTGWTISATFTVVGAVINAIVLFG